MFVTSQLPAPYPVFLDNLSSAVCANTTFCVLHWATEKYITQCRFPHCDIDTALPDMDAPQK